MSQPVSKWFCSTLDDACTPSSSVQWGGGLRQSYATAAEWYRRAADPAKHGDGEGAHAQCSLGRLYAQGKGVPRTALALRRFRRARRWT